MDKNDTRILDAAVETFSRFGVKRTTMNDLAETAGLSRQTLYKSYSNKDDVLRALINHFAQKAIEHIEADLVGVDALDERLDIALRRIVLDGFDMVQKTPNAQDILDGFNEAGRAEIGQAALRFERLLEELLAPARDTLEARGFDLKELARFIYRSGKAASAAETDREQLLRQLRTLRELCVRAAR